MAYDLIIIGGGPSGITAGIYSARNNLKTLLITKSFGGQVARKTVGIENYAGFEEISGLELWQRFEKHLRKQKIDIELDEAVKVEKINSNFHVFTKKGRQLESMAVIVASGADPRPLEVSGEKEFIGRGVSYCTACDGPVFSKKTIAIIGGGNSGFEAALFMTSYAQKIYILESGASFKADPVLQEKVLANSKVEAMKGVILKEIRGDKFLNSVVYQDLKTNQLKTLALDGVFVEIGNQPATSFVKDLVDFNERDEIIVDPKTSQTKTPGLFASGDVDSVPYKQIIIAAGEGAKDALPCF